MNHKTPSELKTWSDAFDRATLETCEIAERSACDSVIVDLTDDAILECPCESATTGVWSRWA